METITIKIDDYKPHPENPNGHPDEQIYELEDGLEQFGQYKNVVVWQGYYLAGHGLVEAARRKGWTEIEAKDMSHLSYEQAKALMIADNRLPELAVMDYAMLNQVIKSLEDPVSIPGVDFDYIGEIEGLAVEGLGLNGGGGGENYSRKIEPPIYEPTGEKPNISDLFDDSRTRELISEIDKADIPEDEKQFLRLAAYRHTVFNFKNIAEYYAHSEIDLQGLMENNALVIIDFNRAIELGFVEFTQEIAKMIKEDYGDD